MNEQISTHELKQLVIRATGMEEAFVNVFMDEMLRLIIETVSTGEEVCIDGLGTFRKVTVGGGQYTRVVFFADDKMKEGVNAPFVQFEPVVLKEGLSIELKESPLVTITETEAIAPVQQLITKEDTEMAKNSDADAKRISAEESEAEQYQKEMAETEAPVEVSNGNGNLTQRVDEVIDDNIAAATGQTCTPTSCPASQNLTKGRYGLWFVIILLAVCIIGTAIYFVVHVKESEKMPVQTEQPASPVSQVLPNTTVLPDSASTLPAIEQVQETPAPVIVAEKSADRSEEQFPKQVVLKRGERLTLLSLRYYGNKFFWIYIFEANKKQYPDPEAVPAGATLIIPDPTQYGIDAGNPTSVEEAKLKAARVLKNL